MYSQNSEEKYIVEYFGSFVGNLLSIGENDGVTLSNSRRLIELGWIAALVEPCPDAFKKLSTLYKDNPNIGLSQCAIGDKDEMVTLYTSGEHLKKGDTGLLSTTVQSEMHRWEGEVFKPITVIMRTYNALFKDSKFDFITLDAEGLDLTILKQIDLSFTRLLCIEWNSIESVKQEILSYCQQFGMNKVIHENAENLLIAR